MGYYDLIKLSTSVIQDFIIFKTEQGSLLRKQKLSYNTVNLFTSVLKQALKYAFKIDLIPKDITINISLPKQKEKRFEIFDEKEQYLLESFCLSKKSNYIGIVICLYTGLRIGELLALTWEDIDLTKRLMSINKTVCTLKISNKSTLYINEPKTKSSLRIIPIPKQIIPYLKQIKNLIHPNISFQQDKMIWYP